MNWVKLTKADNRETVWINLDRFDTILLGTNEDNSHVTQLFATLSDNEEDHLCVEVLESPEEFLNSRQ